MIKPIKQGLKALNRYGLFRTIRYAGLVVVSHPSFGKTRWLRNWMFRALILIFKTLRVKTISVKINDVNLYIDPTNPWSLRTYAFSPFYDWEAISSVKEIISSEYTFIDVGANFGAWSFPLAAHFSKVLAVEPDRRCYECCQKTLRDSGLSNIDFSNVALADSDRDGLLFASSAHIGDSRIYDPGDNDRLTGTQVKLLSFDSLVSLYKVNTGHMFIKLDAQGAEPLILQGMGKALNSANDVILFTEIQPDILAEADLTIQEYLDLLRQMGFSPVDLGNELEGIEWEKVHASLTHDRSTKDYCFRSLK
jgi:FkbM family methyltransferase